MLFVLAVSSVGVYGIALAGWASNNKYALLGGLRSSAQMISYELPMALAIAAPLLIAEHTEPARDGGHAERLRVRLHAALEHFPGPLPQIFSFIIFLIAAFAETNRVPFDLPEAENELVAGFHTEYSSMKFAAFFMAEYANMMTVSCDGDAAVPGRLARRCCRRSTARASSRSLIFVARRTDRALSRPESRARRRPDHAAGRSASSS